MFDLIIEFDEKLFLFLNGLGSPFLDKPMIFLSKKLVWIPLYLFIIFSLIKKQQKTWWIYLIFMVLTIAISDSITSAFMKPWFERLRPCHNGGLFDSIVIINGCGGKYGFASSHAANTFGLAIFSLLFFKNKFVLFLVLWAFLVSYSRIYLGVHYPLDIIIGGIIGSLAGLIMYKIANQLSNRFLDKKN